MRSRRNALVRSSRTTSERLARCPNHPQEGRTRNSGRGRRAKTAKAKREQVEEQAKNDKDYDAPSKPAPSGLRRTAHPRYSRRPQNWLRTATIMCGNHDGLVVPEENPSSRDKEA
jgi:hypothetical protein